MDARQEAIEGMAAQWRRCGIEAGDVVLLHSSASRSMGNLREVVPQASPEDLLETFLMAVGSNEGTLILPLFNFEFTKGVPFDLRATPSQMGALTEAGRKHPDAVRTEHPIYSFAVIGREAERFRGLRNFSGYGPDSPFAVLRELDGKVAILDLSDQDSMTFYHHVEEMHDVPYRYHKTFTADYVDWNGERTERTFGLFVRDIDKGVKTHVNPMGEILWEKALYTGDLPHHGAGLRVIRSRQLYKAVSEVITEGRAEGLLYRIEHD